MAGCFFNILQEKPPKEGHFVVSKKIAAKGFSDKIERLYTLQVPECKALTCVYKSIVQTICLTGAYNRIEINLKLVSDKSLPFQLGELTDPVAMAFLVCRDDLIGANDTSRSLTLEKCNYCMQYLAPSIAQSRHSAIVACLKDINSWLSKSKWLTGVKPSLADLMAFCLINELTPNAEPFKNVPLLHAWFIKISSDHLNFDLPKPDKMNDALLKELSKLDSSTPNGEGESEKTDAQKKKDAKKLEKLAKFEAKLSKKDPAPKTDRKKDQKVASTEKKTISEDMIVNKQVPNVTSTEMPDAYDPKFVEAKWYDWWEKEGFFKPEYKPEVMDCDPTQAFTMVIPPPNVTGVLHLGHALTNSIEDAVTRWHRMMGHRTLWNPGCDHAGIATQVVVEKKVFREKNLSRHDMGRDAFVKEIWKWKEEKGDMIYHQLRTLGSSCDWGRARFTMDDMLSKAVLEAFVRLHDEGLIFRANRLVNWSCTLNSAISDIEVDKKDIPGPTFLEVPGYTEKIEFGSLISFAYKVEESTEEIVIATTRIETMLGDSAVAVHPQDKRYFHLHGKFVVHPFVPNRRMPIVQDDFVDMEFGTGAVKITPAHDPNDFEVGHRHNLPFITIIDDNGCISSGCGQFSGMKRFHARKSVLEALKQLNLFRGVQPNPMVVPTCSRSKDIIEPLLKPQWYLRCKEMADAAMEVVRDGQLKIIPDYHEKTWYTWLTDCRDWCISRQLWWGHQIPAYLVKINGQSTESDSADNASWVSGRTHTEAMTRATAKFGVPADQITLEQDQDVLDTWFSSQLFPFAVFGWPDDTPDLRRFYPGSLLETGHDILFFWVARMVMIGLKLLGKLPFTEVYLHAMMRDAHGKKMSKSLGNAIDPCDVIEGISLKALQDKLKEGNLDPKELKRAEHAQKADYPSGIPECGTDALRFALCAYSSQGRTINLDVLRVQGYRFFCNKLWNAARYALVYCLQDYTPPESLTTLQDPATQELLSPVDKWMLSRLSYAVSTCNTGFRTYDFQTVTTACYNLWLYEFCDVYLEYTKSFVKEAKNKSPRAQVIRHLLYSCLEIGLLLIHPMMPFVTEELYQRLPRRPVAKSEPSICVCKYPTVDEFPWFDETVESDMKLVLCILHTIRNLRATYRLGKNQRPVVILVVEDNETQTLLQPYRQDVLESLANCQLDHIQVRNVTPSPTQCVVGSVSSRCSVYMKRGGMIDAAKEIERLEPQVKKITDQIEKIKAEMAIEDYEEKVPENVRVQKKKQVDDLELELQQIEKSLMNLRS